MIDFSYKTPTLTTNATHIFLHTCNKIEIENPDLILLISFDPMPKYSHHIDNTLISTQIITNLLFEQ